MCILNSLAILVSISNCEVFNLEEVNQITITRVRRLNIVYSDQTKFSAVRVKRTENSSSVSLYASGYRGSAGIH